MRSKGAFLFVFSDTNNLVKVSILGAGWRDILDCILDAKQLMSIFGTIPRVLDQLSFTVLEIHSVKLERLVLGQLGDGITLCKQVNMDANLHEAWHLLMWTGIRLVLLISIFSPNSGLVNSTPKHPRPTSLSRFCNASKLAALLWLADEALKTYRHCLMICHCHSFLLLYLRHQGTVGTCSKS